MSGTLPNYRDFITSFWYDKRNKGINDFIPNNSFLFQ